LSTRSLMINREVTSDRRIRAQSSMAELENRLALVKTPYVTYPFDVTGGSVARSSDGGGSMMIEHGRW
jgi:hypothetical protein